MQPGNPDIREAVERNRGLLKKIQLIVPGFRGYRKLDDLRAADQLLRRQISDILQGSLNALQQERIVLVNGSDFGNLTLIGSGISQVQQFQGELLHSQQGYSGISPTIRINEEKLNSLYEYDLKFLEVASNIRDLSNLSSSGDVSTALRKLFDAVSLAKTTWQARLEAVEKILLTPGGSQ